MKSFAIVVIGYKRVEGISRLIKSLEKADYDNRNDITLIFSIDNSGDSEVEDYAKSVEWKHGEKIIRTFDKRQGLKKHILSCGEYTTKYDILTVLEDDIVVSDSFYHYAYSAAIKYEEDDHIAGISLYNFQKNWLKWSLRFEPEKKEFDNYFMQIAQSWGQVWTLRKWNLFMEWYKDNKTFLKSETIPSVLNNWPESSWLKYHTRYCIETDRYFVYPYYALSTNCGDAGEHSKRGSSNYQVELQSNKYNYIFADFFEEDSVTYDAYMNRIGLNKYLGIDDANDVKIDFYGTNRLLGYRYLLSTAKLDYQIIKSYELSFRPIEYSIIHNIEGKGIYLYDTFIKEKNRLDIDQSFELLSYEMRSNSLPTIWEYAIKLLIKELKSRIMRGNKE